MLSNRNKWQTWGWYNVLKSIADSGAFNKPPMSPMESAMYANFYECMIYMANEKHMNESPPKNEEQ